jgi:hypothetical protein
MQKEVFKFQAKIIINSTLTFTRKYVDVTLFVAQLPNNIPLSLPTLKSFSQLL